jgi:D-amino-acid dehydrogenase
MNGQRYDAVVVGGGIVGTSAAYALVRQGVRTLLVDRADPGRATAAGAGIISPEAYNGGDHPWYRLLVGGLEYYPELIDEIGGGEADTGYAACGQLVVPLDAEENAVFAANSSQILALWDQRGAGEEDIQVLSGPEARRFFPPLAAVEGGLLYRRAARVDGRRLNQALLEQARRQGLHTRQAEVESVVLEAGVVRGVDIAGERVATERLIIAGGAWSAHWSAQLGLGIPVEPQRGQIVHLRLRDVDTRQWPIVFGLNGHYMVPWPDGRLAVGATHESVGFAAAPTAEGVQEVLDRTLLLAPGLAAAEFVEVRVGLRPVSVDGLPVLGPIPGIDGAFVATGHGAVGLHLGPLSGRLIADMALGHTIGYDLSPFDPGRFPNYN